MKLQRSFLIAIILCIVGLSAWELYWRSNGYYPDLDDNKDLWSVQRARVEKATKNDVLLLGASRVLFDIQLDEWEEVTGKRPIQLASEGSSPLPVFRDIVENTDFNGTIIVGVAPPVFFDYAKTSSVSWKWPQARIAHFYDRTYAQRLNHLISLPLQKNIAFLSTSEMETADPIDLKTLLDRVKIGNRIPAGGPPPLFNFKDIAVDRNSKMKDRTVTDTAFANSITKVWQFYGQNSPPPDKDGVIKYFIEDVKKFKEKGGNLILVRCPSTGGSRMGESHVFARHDFWDQVVLQANVNGYHFEDYDQLKHFDCPEWSHLSASDASIFTTELAKIMQNDGALTNQKIN